ncbi:MAG: DsbA family protein [Candidatus Micrarchaeota archaeon]
MDRLTRAKMGVLFGVLSIAVFAMALNGCVSSGEQSPTDPASPGGPDGDARAFSGTDPFAALMDDDHVKGDMNAPVTMVEFSDFECPFCGRYYEDTYKRINEEYIATGKVRYAFRDYPLGFHPYAQNAAEAAQCAGDQGRYWEMHDKLFENQDALSVSDLRRYSAELGLDTSMFDQCLDSGKYSQEVQADKRAGDAAGVSGTPTFFINGKKLVGAVSYETFEFAIEEALRDSGVNG